MKKYIFVFFLLLLTLPCFAKNYLSVDTRAQKAPSRYDQSLPQLVQYLIKPYQTNEEDKARVLLAWIVYHIDYDVYKSDQIQKKASLYSQGASRLVSTGDIFYTRIGVCGDIAQLYQRMLGLAGLDSVVVSGYAGHNLTRQDLSVSRHAWNAVSIDGKWELIDPTWAMRGETSEFQDVGTRRGHSREIKKRLNNPARTNKARKNRKIDERWFKTKPREMIKTHYPLDENWQLLSNPKTLSSFLR